MILKEALRKILILLIVYWESEASDFNLTNFMCNRLFHEYRENVIPKTLTGMFRIVNSEANKIKDDIIFVILAEMVRYFFNRIVRKICLWSTNN